MNLIIAVIDDLYTFARDAIRSLLTPGRKTQPSEPYLLAGVADPVKLPGSVETASGDEEIEIESEDAPLTFRSTNEILESTLKGEGTKNTVMYTGSEQTSLFRQPTMEFDSVIGHIPYGSLVMVLESRGRWARIAHKSVQGWALRDELSDRAAYVYPDFTIGQENRHDDPNTLRVRACIADEFGAGKAEMPLQSSEYVLYRLCKKGIRVNWPGVRPRVEGTWHEILKGREHVQIGVRACGGCIMEYVNEDGTGHLAYVEAVFPDETLTISEANFPADGIYNERVLTKEEWRELKPIFLEFS